MGLKEAMPNYRILSFLVMQFERGGGLDVAHRDILPLQWGLFQNNAFEGYPLRVRGMSAACCCQRPDLGAAKLEGIERWV